MTEQVATMPTWARVLAILVGLFSMAAAFVVLVFPGIAVLTLVLLLGTALLFIGIDRLADGISGHPYRWMVVASVGPAAPTDKAPVPPASQP
jgi:uncharacterized membrane protein HdeD (DUF308 family)